VFFEVAPLKTGFASRKIPIIDRSLLTEHSLLITSHFLLF